MTTHIEKILSVVSVMRYILPANAGACLSPKDEFAQEHERIRHMYRVGNEANLFIWMVMLQYNPAILLAKVLQNGRRYIIMKRECR